MAKRKACKMCKMLVEGDTCPSCKSGVFTESWKGRLYLTDVANSQIAQKIGTKVKGEYALKVQ